MRTIVLTSLLAIAPACAGSEEEPFEQPGQDDPSARDWEKAGSWYPEDRELLDADVADLLAQVDAEPRPAAAVLTPHASLTYSGPTAAEAFARVEIPDTVLMLAPDHWGDGKPTSVWTEGPWLVPGHAIEVDDALLSAVRAALPDLESDRVAFSHHESEMQLPFLQYLHPEVRIVPIAIFDNSRNDFAEFDIERIEQWGTAVADVVRAEEAAGQNVLILATTDLVHHETADVSTSNDTLLMDYIAALDVQGLYDFVLADGVTICGEIPTAIMMAALLDLGYTQMSFATRGDSLHANGDDTDVIGYPAAVAYKE